MRNKHSSTAGFTLAELLIALAILGVIAAFAIPKVLQSQQDAKFNAIAKEAASMISGAYLAYQRENTPTAATTTADLRPYMNYIRIDSTSDIDNVQTGTTYSCSLGYNCLILANGAKVWLLNGNFGGTDSLATIRFYVDPDGVTNGTVSGPGKSVCFFLHFNGKLDTWGTAATGSYYSGGLFNPAAPAPSLDPPWFSWD